MPAEQMTVLEAAARAMCHARHPCWSIVAEIMSDGDYRPGQEGDAAALTQAGELRMLAAAALEEIGLTAELILQPAASLVVVPNEATGAMKVAGGLAIESAMFEEGKLVFEAAADVHRAMIAARPGATAPSPEEPR
ncbi:hypothetical protein [Pseudoroseomonas cervicalis]|uniref:hypothetical protein n=1 Tax=Teichococcus cervicalis TaxID=204525 RepID=UPI00278354C0|nr:hypothetical protein [Pseudoroseomonas cervicalis]MDQ1081411.1 hypothetical protein [Pseudoroseomonas cervicalis]